MTQNIRGKAHQKKTCAICLGSMKPGQGRALFTAECSHSFHFSCIASCIKHGNHLCPICRSHWNEIPCQAPVIVSSEPTVALSQSNSRARVSPLDNVHHALQSTLPHHQHLLHTISLSEPPHFDDDEPLLTPTLSMINPSLQCQDATINAFPEFPAVPASQSCPGFTVLVSLRAPPPCHQDRTPIDLVMVVDVSASMAGIKLTLLKRALVFVIHHLGPTDRISVVFFSSSAWRLFPLCRMTDEGRDRAIQAINSLRPGGGTNIVEGLRKGVRVLEERQQKNPVSSVILLSDGRDTHNTDNSNPRRNTQTWGLNSERVLDYLNFLPPSIRHGNHDSIGAHGHPIPVHTFGFGTDHDAPAMHAISDVSGGMFSFIEAECVIQDAFARCIGGLLSVVVQELRLTLSSASSGVVIDRVPAGNYLSEVSDQGRHAIVKVGDLYADEAKDFLVHVSVPFHSSESGPDVITPLLTIRCSYKHPLSQETIQVEGEMVKIHRPTSPTSEDQMVCLEVDRQRNRLLVAEAIAEAQALAEEGNFEKAQMVLANRRLMLLASASAQAGDLLCNWLEAELKEIRERMASQELYEESGRAYVLSGLSSHSWQRATTRGDTTILVPAARDTHGLSMSGPIGYETPSMANMVTRSQTLNFFVPEQEPVGTLHRSCSLNPR
ncbi:E3 ubiquitin-protein ligase WAV3-like isoform X2 [Magnolia sinica]|uniref:E3 ubiquitin-protein ligase WAV3-like isoform X2 n=1 Tax=Magnolia sinica TaxID=86752 RepID=UPI00265A5E6C|nr:E3 ubiquitin-protein ligase WAV3-like isoform X2 [Magnolia sinica]